MTEKMPVYDSKLPLESNDLKGGAAEALGLDTPGGEQERKLLELFSASEMSLSDEREMEARIRSVLREYLQEECISSNEDFESLQSRFEHSEMPEGTLNLGRYVDYIAEAIIPHSIRTSSRRFVGHMTSALPSFVRPLQILIAALNQNLVKVETSKVFTAYERQAIAMMHRLVFSQPSEFYQLHTQQAQSTLGMIVSGGTLANLTALWCARNQSLRPTDGACGIEEQGLAATLSSQGYQEAVIIGSGLLHYSFQKVAGILGIGTRNLKMLPVDRRGRIELSALREAIAECRENKKCIIALVGVAGSTDCGSIDPLSQMAEIASGEGIHFHVDAAWGGPLLFSETNRRKLSGIEAADSVTIDGHKQLYLPMGVGLLLLRDPYLAQSIEKSAAYIIRAGSADLGRYSVEGSRPDRVTLLQAALNVIGRKGYALLIDEGIRKTNYLAARIRARAEFELLCEPEMNILVYRYLPAQYRERVGGGEIGPSDTEFVNRFNTALQKAQLDSGYSFVSRTTLNNTSYGCPVAALRCVIANPLTRESDLDAILEHQIEIAAGLQVA